MSGWLKAGLIGIGVLVVLSLLGLIPILGLCIVPLRWVTYVVVGILAASYMLPPRAAGKAAGEGALAGVVAAAGGGIVNVVLAMVQVGTTGAMQLSEALRQLPPEVMQQLRDAGVPPEMLLAGPGAGAASIGTAAVCGSLCCLGGIFFAAALGAIGAAIYASTKPQ